MSKNPYKKTLRIRRRPISHLATVIVPRKARKDKPAVTAAYQISTPGRAQSFTLIPTIRYRKTYSGINGRGPTFDLSLEWLCWEMTILSRRLYRNQEGK